MILEGKSSQMLIKLCVQPWTGLTFKTFQELLLLGLEQGLGDPLHRTGIFPSTEALCRILERFLGAEGMGRGKEHLGRKCLASSISFFYCFIAGEY